MSTAKNKAVVRRLWEEVWNQANRAAADEIFDDACAAHEKSFVTVVRAAFPDSHHGVEDSIAEGDRVVTRFIWSGTHRGAFMGVPPTDRSVAVGGIWIHRLERAYHGRPRVGAGGLDGLAQAAGCIDGSVTEQLTVVLV